MKNAKERMDVIAAYRDVGTYRGAAAICGTTHKTVRRVIGRWVNTKHRRRPMIIPVVLEA